MQLYKHWHVFDVSHFGRRALVKQHELCENIALSGEDHD